MSTNALDTQGMTIAVLDTTVSPNVYNTISDATNITGPDVTVTEKDATDLSSTAKQYKNGLPDLGPVSFNLGYQPADTQHAQLFSDSKSSTQSARSYRITYTDSPQTTLTFNAFVSGFSHANELDALSQATVTLRLTGTGITVA